MSNDKERDDDMSILDRVKEMFGFISEEKIKDIEKDIKILKDTSDDIQRDIKKSATNIALKAVQDKQKTLDDDIKNVKENLKKDVISDFKVNLEPILKNYAEQYLEKRNERYLKEYKDIENHLILAKQETIEVLKNDKEKFENNLQEKKEEIEKLKGEIQNLETKLNSKNNLSKDLEEAQETIESLKSQLNSQKEGADDLQAKNDGLSKDLKEAQETIEGLKSQLNSQKEGADGLQVKNDGLFKELKEAQETIEGLKSQLNSQKEGADGLQVKNDGLSKDLKEAQEIIESLRINLSSKQSELDNSEDEKAESEKELSNAISKISTLENIIKEKEIEIESLENKNKKEKESTLNEREEMESRLQDFIEKIENPYKDLLKAISENSKSKEIEEYLKFKNDRGLSKSMIIFSLINEDALARKIASFYAERKEVMIEEDFEIIKEVNKIYENDKPWGILYAEPEGKYLSSLVRDKKSSDIYKTFVAMYSPAYRKDEDGNSPLKGIVDGKK